MSAPGRAPRRAATAALQKLEDDERVVISSSDGSSGEEDDDEDVEAEESEEEPTGPAPLSAYEQRRAETIAKNNEVLASLGLARPPLTAKTTRTAATKKSPASGGSGRSRPNAASSSRQSRSRSPSVASAESASDEEEEISHHSASTGRTGRTTRAERQDCRPTFDGLSEREIDSYFTLVCGGTRGGLLHASQISAIAKDLNLDTTRDFTEDAIENMIDCFDGEGKGALSIEDFRRVMQQC